MRTEDGDSSPAIWRYAQYCGSVIMIKSGWTPAESIARRLVSTQTVTVRRWISAAYGIICESDGPAAITVNGRFPAFSLKTEIPSSKATVPAFLRQFKFQRLANFFVVALFIFSL